MSNFEAIIDQMAERNDSDSVDVEKLIEDLKEDGDIDHLQGLAKLIEMAIQELEEDPD